MTDKDMWLEPPTQSEPRNPNRKEYLAKYSKEHSKIYRVRFNTQKHDHIIRWLEMQPNINKYIRDLIEDDLTRVTENHLKNL